MKNRTIKINNLHLQNFLEERGIRPVKEDYITGSAIYKRDKKLISLLESYEIVRCAVSNGR